MATATESKERTIFSVKGTASGVTVELCKPASQTLVRAAVTCKVLSKAPGCEVEAAAAEAAINTLLSKVQSP